MRHQQHQSLESELIKEVETREKLFNFLMTDIRNQIVSDHQDDAHDDENRSKVRQVTKDLICATTDVLHTLVKWGLTIDDEGEGNDEDDREQRLVELCSKFELLSVGGKKKNSTSSSSKNKPYLQHLQDTSLEIVSCPILSQFLRKEKEIKQLLLQASDEAVVMTHQQQKSEATNNDFNDDDIDNDNEEQSS